MKKINIAEILKDCPKGMELDCTMFDNVTFVRVDSSSGRQFPIEIAISGQRSKYLTKEGCFHDNTLCPEAKCVIFPKGKTTWEGFQRPFKDGDVVMTEDGMQAFIFKENAKYLGGYYTGICYIGYDFECEKIFKINEGVWRFTQLATEEEKEKLFDAIKANGYKWNPETKTLEKLEVKKFDITTLKPFKSRVLVRDYNDDAWRPAIFGAVAPKTTYNDLPFVVVGGCFYEQCIPYENNERLLGTTNDCDEYYKTWE